MSRVILDVDAGVDDIYALLMLLHAQDKNQVTIEAVTCVRGNTTVDNVYRNVQRTLDITNRRQIPVYIGDNEPIMPRDIYYEPKYYGNDGFGDLDYGNIENILQNSTTNAVEAIISIVKEYPGEISLLCCGPLTNIALAMKMYPKLGGDLKDIFIMGGNYAENCDKEEPYGEFNFLFDIEAAHIVLYKVKCPVIILPKETCETTIIPYEWRFQELGKINSPIVELLNNVEEQYFKPNYNWITYDPLLVAILLNPAIIKKHILASVSINIFDNIHRGEMITQKEDNGKVKIITKLNTDLFKIMLYKSLVNLIE